jgi:hypothetical protein
MELPKFSSSRESVTFLPPVRRATSDSGVSLDSEKTSSSQCGTVCAFQTVDDEMQVDKIFLWMDEDDIDKIKTKAYTKALEKCLKAMSIGLNADDTNAAVQKDFYSSGKSVEPYGTEDAGGLRWY